MYWPSRKKKEDIELKTELESLYSKVENVAHCNENLDEIKVKLKSFLYKVNQRRNDVSIEVRKQIEILKRLSKRNDLYICKFDKGNGIFIDNKQRYIDEMNKLLNDSERFRVFTQNSRAKNDPFIIAQENFNKKLKKLANEGKIDDEVYNKVRSVGSQPARLYGLSKVHKDKNNPPYRPVLSMPNSYSTNLSKWLDSLLKPLIPTNNCVKDSFDFCEQIKSMSFKNSKSCMVSFDVKSLFTNIPVKETISYICNKIPADKLPIEKDTLRTLLEMACTNIMFTFNKNIYMQYEGMAMGTNLGPTMAAFCMDMIEIKMKKDVMFYKRYVDDVFAIFKTKLQASKFLKDINKIHKNIQFTMEEERNNSINFLDIRVDNKEGMTFPAAHTVPFPTKKQP